MRNAKLDPRAGDIFQAMNSGINYLITKRNGDTIEYKSWSKPDSMIEEGILDLILWVRESKGDRVIHQVPDTIPVGIERTFDAITSIEAHLNQLDMRLDRLENKGL